MRLQPFDIGPRMALAGFLVSQVLIGGAAAASFDCHKAQSKLEKAICADPIISAEDERLNRLYQERADLLSPLGKTLLVRSQRSWLRYLDASISSQNGNTFPLSSEYEKRISQLQQVMKTADGLTLNRIDVFRTFNAPPDKYGAYLSIEHVGYPQIDDPKTAAMVQWNHQHMQSLKHIEQVCGGDSAGLEDNDYTLGWANQTLISLTVSTQDYCRGYPHGLFSNVGENLFLSTPLRKLKWSNVFLGRKQTREKVQKLFVNRMEPDQRGSADIVDAVENAAINPGSWTLTPTGIKLNFSAYESGSYMGDPHVGEVTWTDLKPFLRAGAPVP